MNKHFIVGSGLHGCMFQDGPIYFDSLRDSVSYLVDMYGLGRRRAAELRRNLTLELNLSRDGNEYCEIQEVHCTGEECEYCRESQDECGW